MSAPSAFYTDNAHGAVLEIISAMSALNMEPLPLKDADPEAIFLSDTDHWVNHSMDHLHRAVELLQGESRPIIGTVTSVSAAASLVSQVRSALLFHDIPMEGDEAIALWGNSLALMEQAYNTMRLAALASMKAEQAAFDASQSGATECES
jgi:hypothetical protein